MFVSPETMGFLLSLELSTDKLVELVKRLDDDARSMQPPVPIPSPSKAEQMISERRAYDRDRKRVRRNSTGSPTNSADPSPSEVSPTPPSYHPLSSPPLPPTGEFPPQGRTAAEFDVWYAGYPHKVSRADAVKAFTGARKKAPLAELIAGLDRYVASKPPDVPWCNPATWLNRERWKDQPAPQPQAMSRPHERSHSHPGNDRTARAYAGAMDFLDERADRDRGGRGGDPGGPAGPGDGQGGYARIAGPLSAVR